MVMATMISIKENPLENATARISTKNCDNNKVSARNLGQIGVKQDRATEACFQHVAGSDDEADPQDGLKCEQLLEDIECHLRFVIIKP